IFSQRTSTKHDHVSSGFVYASAMRQRQRAVIPLWFKIAYTLFVCFLVPIYWRRYGPVNFLWFSDIALLVTMPALWLESPLIASMMAVAVTLPGLAWKLDFFVWLTTGASFMGLRSYIFDRRIPLFIPPFYYSTWGCHCFSSGCFTGSVTMSALSARKRLSQLLYCRSRISSATRSRISIGFTGLVRDLRLEFQRFGSWHF